MRSPRRNLGVPLAGCGLVLAIACGTPTPAASIASVPPAASARAVPAPAPGMLPAGASAADTAGGAFLEAARCALCHSHGPRALAMTIAAGEDVPPHGTC